MIRLSGRRIRFPAKIAPSTIEILYQKEKVKKGYLCNMEPSVCMSRVTASAKEITFLTVSAGKQSSKWNVLGTSSQRRVQN